MDFKCPKCNKSMFDWDGRAKVMRCLWDKCRFVCSVPLPDGLDSWRQGSPTDCEKYNACLAAKAGLTGGMYSPDPGFDTAWRNYIFAVNVVRRANNFPILTNEQCDELGKVLMDVTLLGAKTYEELIDNLGAAAAKYGKSDWPEEDRERGYVLKDSDD